MSQQGDGDGYVSVYEASARRARKEHRCGACQETIRPGDTYTHVFLVWEGEPYVYKRCARCEAIFKHLEARISAEGDSEEFCHEQLACGHEYRERWGEPPPEALAALAFWRPGDPLPELP